MNLESDLARLKERLKEARSKKGWAEGQLAAAEQEKQRILVEMAELGVSPENLDGEVARLEKEIAELLDQARRLIPRELAAGQG